MKRYREYMDSVNASDTLHQRLLGLEASGKRPIPWKKYGGLAAALVLVCGLGAWGLGKAGGWDALAENFQFDTEPEIADAAQVDIAPVEPGDEMELGEKTLGGYEVVSGSGEDAMTTYYILPYIDYGGTGGGETAPQAASLDWDIPVGASRRDLAQGEIEALLGGGDAVNTHLDWGGYELTGWAAWYEDGSFWGAYLYGYMGPMDHFEFAVTAGQLPPTCIGYPGSVTQEIRGLTVTADGHDGKDGCARRVSFMKDDCGCRFDLTSTNTEQAELLVSRLVARIADKGLALTYTCPYCGHTFPFGAIHHDPMISAEGGYTCPDCGVAIPVGDKHYHTYENGGASTEPYDPGVCGYPLAPGEDDPYVCTGYPVPDPGDGGKADMGAPPRLNVMCGSDSLDSGSGNYEWTVDLGDGLTSGTIACGVHPLDFQDAPSLTTAEGGAELSFAGSPDRVRVICWPDSEWGNTGAQSQECSAARNSLTLDYEIALNQGGWIYELTAEWDGYGTAGYVFYIIRN